MSQYIPQISSQSLQEKVVLITGKFRFSTFISLLLLFGMLSADCMRFQGAQMVLGPALSSNAWRVVPTSASVIWIISLAIDYSVTASKSFLLKSQTSHRARYSRQPM